MRSTLKVALGVAGLALATQTAAQITFYEGEGFSGQAFTADGPIRNLERFGFNDRASSVVIDRERWEVCEDTRFEGHCVILRHGSYASLRSMGLNNRISSVRPVQRTARYDEVPPPVPEPTYQYRPRPDERLYEVPVSNVHAVVGPPERRCWVERRQVVEERRSEPNIGGAIIGGIVGGVLGHQIGGGTGRDVATAGGAVAGAAIGANAGRGESAVAYDRDVERCTTAPPGPPQYWDVTYFYRGIEHHVQLSAPPGATILVNANGEPRQ